MADGGVATIGGRQYAVGLYWQPSPSKSVAKAARDAAKAPGQKADYLSIRNASKTGRLAQFGLGQKSSGHQLGMPAAAPSLADQLPGSWTGAFKVDEGYWVITLRDDLIDPEGDMLYTDEASAMARIDQEMSRGGLQRVYAPENWAIPDSDHTKLVVLLGGKQASKLQYTQLPRSYVFSGVAVAAMLVLAGGGWYLYQQHQESLRQEQEAIALHAKQAKDRADADARRRALSAQHPNGPVQWPPYKRVWRNSPLPEAWLTACENALAKIPATLPGWNLANVKCTGTSLLINWSRGFGPAVNLIGLNVDPGEKKASLAVPLEHLHPRGPQALWKRDDFNTYSLEHNLPVTLTVLPDDPPPPPPQGAPKDAKPPPPWFKKRGVKFDVKGAPWYWAITAHDIPGLVFTNLSWSGTTWTLEGTVYEKISDKED